MLKLPQINLVKRIENIESSWVMFLGLFAAAFLISATSVMVYSLRSTDSQEVVVSAQVKAEPTPDVNYVPNSDQEIIAFLPSWVIAKKEKLNLDKLTQLIYFGIGVNEDGSLVKIKDGGDAVLEWQYLNSDVFKEIRREAKQNNTKILVALKNFDNQEIDQLISDPYAIGKFIKEASLLIEDYDLDGINIDFEYVTQSDFPTAKHFNGFLSEVSQSLREKYPDIVISVDLNATAVLVDPAYDMVKIGELADQVILMGYDYHTMKSSQAGPIAPLHAVASNGGSIEKSLESLTGRVPDNKTILGIPFYGYEWETVSEKYQSKTVRNSGALATWGRVHDLLESRDDIQVNWDKKTQSPWLVYKQSGAIKQIYYENKHSLSAKMNFVKQNNLGGIAIWALGYEGDHKEAWDIIAQ
ncbi:MAG: glycosyl hydrolase family 18 protein [bacterium]|nr:glycosyl hydrolase family 18 protein [bacterium]